MRHAVDIGIARSGRSANPRTGTRRADSSEPGLNSLRGASLDAKPKVDISLAIGGVGCREHYRAIMNQQIIAAELRIEIDRRLPANRFHRLGGDTGLGGMLRVAGEAVPETTQQISPFQVFERWLGQSTGNAVAAID